MHRFMPKLSLATPLVAICLTVASSAAIAQNSRVDQAGHTSVALSAGFVAALGDLDVTPGTIYPTELEDGKVSFRLRAACSIWIRRSSSFCTPAGSPSKQDRPR